jgi:cytochrome c2
MRSIVIAASLFVSAALALPAAAGDATEGRTVFEANCAKCHSLDPTVPGYRGPHLAGLFDRQYGAVEDFSYRMVWTDANPRWTREHLNNYLEIHLLPDAGERADLIEFLFEATRK